MRGRLRVAVGESPLRREHERLLRTALRRGGRRPEREEGERIDAGLSVEALAIARRTWLARMLHEHHSAAVFSRLLPQLIEAEATLDVKTAVLRMAMDELRHASLCGDVVAALGATPELDADLATEPLPEHPGTTPRERALRNLLFCCCLSETVALSLLTVEYERATVDLPRRVLAQLRADEVRHARIGWIHLAETLPRLDAPARRRLHAYLPLAFAHLDRSLLAALPLPPRPRSAALRHELASVGLIDAGEARALYLDVVAEVIVPRLEEAGLPAGDAFARRAE